jgi:Cd2+/Zn2+-exporting ATPase
VTKGQKKTCIRLAIGLVLYIIVLLLPVEQIFGENIAGIAKLILFLVPYLVIGGGVLLEAVENIAHGQVFDENFLMCVATIGAICLGDYTEAVAVMLFYQVGELFEDFAVNRSRQSISELMDIRPDYANIERDGELVRVDPEEVQIGDTIIVKPGERVPLDGVILDGESQLDTAALTGESLPREVSAGDEVISGSVNLNGLLHVRVTKVFGESTVARILELVESAADKKAKTENFITRFARYYTPAVCACALLIAVVPPLFVGNWGSWIERGLTFLIVSCPCALVISVPLSFFGGIGGASKYGVLIKGSNYLEELAKADIIVFDKTGTLTNGSFSVVAVHPEEMDEERLLELAAHAESASSHPIAQSIIAAYGKPIDSARVGAINETAGNGISAIVDGVEVLVGNERGMTARDIASRDCEHVGTIIHVAVDGKYEGHIVIADTPKPDSAAAIAELRALGVEKTVMLTGDREEVAAAVAKELGLDEYHAELLPADKVSIVERLLNEKDEKVSLAFVGDGINDAPVLARAEIGIAMGALGSDAAIEAADVVLMDDKLSSIVTAVKIARKTMRIVYSNIVFALAVKLVILLITAIGFGNMWLAVFGDVGVAVLAILNAMRCMKIK